MDSTPEFIWWYRLKHPGMVLTEKTDSGRGNRWREYGPTGCSHGEHYRAVN